MEDTYESKIRGVFLLQEDIGDFTSGSRELKGSSWHIFIKLGRLKGRGRKVGREREINMLRGDQPGTCSLCRGPEVKNERRGSVGGEKQK